MLQKAKCNVPLKEWTTFGIGGNAEHLIEVRDIPLMQELLPFCKKESIPYLVLGKGSNVLINDQGFSGLVIINRIDFLEKKDPLTWHVGAGYSFSLLGTQTAREGLSGLEFASGIPASVGGAVFMNAGANGTDTQHSLLSVDYVTPEGDLQTISKENLSFSYRFSSFQKLPGVIVGATFSLKPIAEARENQLDIIRYRTKTQPYGSKSAGCVFRNPLGNHAGALIDQHGLKGTTIGGAQVSTLHGNFLINSSSATCEDVLQLISSIQKKIKADTGIELETEIRYIPYNK